MVVCFKVKQLLCLVVGTQHNTAHTIKGSQVWALGISGYMCTYMYMYMYMIIMIMTFCDGSLESEGNLSTKL